jgi:hypothetical protein
MAGLLLFWGMLGSAIPGRFCLKDASARQCRGHSHFMNRF